MGYSTDFFGVFTFNKKLDLETHIFLNKFCDTRHMARNVDAKYGVEGEFYVDGKGDFGQAHESNIINYNMPPKTQPGLWCHWKPSEDGTMLEWDGGEKFYDYVKWLEYLIVSLLAPKGYVLNGEVEWVGESNDDRGKIIVKENKIKILHAKIIFEEQP